MSSMAEAPTRASPSERGVQVVPAARPTLRRQARLARPTVGQRAFRVGSGKSQWRRGRERGHPGRYAARRRAPGAKPKRYGCSRAGGPGPGAFAALVAWGVLVWLAIDFGRSARGGESGKWVYLAAASVGAVVCLFLCLWLVTLLLRRVGILEETRAAAQTHRH